MINCGTLIVFIVLCCCTLSSNSSNILFLTVYGSRSHVLTISPAMESLSSRGHNVTYLTFLSPEFEQETNVTVLPLKEVQKFIATNRYNFFERANANFIDSLKFVSAISYGLCAATMNDPNFKRVAEDKTTKYDVIIADPSFSECALPLVKILNDVPLIYYCTTYLYSWTALALDIPTPFAYVPLYFLPFQDNMTFSERYTNAIASFFFVYFRKFYLMTYVEQLIRETYSTLPGLADIERNASFVFANSYSPALDLGRPLAPFFAEVGGAHCRPPRPLPKNIESFIEGAGHHGFIYFSTGTYIRGSDMSKDKLQSFIVAFGKLKQRVIWKFDDVIPNLPSNVQVFKWVPQQDILGHPKIKVFITQGGQLSIQEAIYHSVPVLGLPVFGEHFSTLNNLHRKGTGEILDYQNLNADNVYASLMKIISDKRYEDNCAVLSNLFRDRPMEAIDTIIYWVEYTIRHNGGSHLRFSTGHLNLFQYFLLDVLAIILLAFVFFCFIIFKGCKLFSRLISKREVVTRVLCEAHTNRNKKYT